MTRTASDPSGPADDAGSLTMALLLIMVGVALTGLVSSMVLTQLGTTRSMTRRDHAVYAAQAGLEALLAQVRAADDGHGTGVRASLPCGPVSGRVGGGTTEQYQVTLYYTDFDPQTRMSSSASWFAANAITCTTGSGPSTLPKYLVAYAVGSESGTSRTVRGAYRLRTTNQNIAGGRVHRMSLAGNAYDLCMDSGTTVTPTAGTPLMAQTCDTGRPQQIFAYTRESRLQMVNSVTSGQPLGMCLDAGSSPTNGAPVTFQSCTSPAPSSQQWELQGGGQFENVYGWGGTNGFIMELVSPDASASTVKVTNAATAWGFNKYNSFAAENAVGAGNAGPQNKQLVNYQQFGRCLDLTGGNYQAGFMIAWPCKPSWNQSYDTPTLAISLTGAVPGKITLTVTGTGNSTPPGFYCLKSPRSTAPWQYAVLVSCTATDPSIDLQWRVFGYTGTYGTSYRIMDVDGNCLQPTDNTVPNADIWSWGDGISKIVIQPCTDSLLQKWNADPDVLTGMNLKYVGE